MKILVVNIFLGEYRGSELATVDFAKLLIRKGHDVFLGAFFIKDPLKTYIDGLGIKTICLAAETYFGAKQFDLLIGQHLNDLLPHIIKQGLDFEKIVAFSLSPYVPVEALHDDYNLFNHVYVNSDETLKVRLHETSIQNIDIFYNSITPEFFNEEPAKRKPSKNILLADNNNFLNDELFTKKAMSRGIRIDFMGMNKNTYKIISPEILMSYDAVMTIGRTVQYCLGLKIPVYCYGRFGGSGWVSKDTFYENKKMNFSGRKENLSEKNFSENIIEQHDLDYILEDIISNYASTLSDLEWLNAKAKEYFSLSKNLDTVLNTIESKNINFSEIKKIVWQNALERE